MFEYKYVALSNEMRDVTSCQYQEHRDIINHYAADGWRYAGWMPVVITSSGEISKLDLIFEREK